MDTEGAEVFFSQADRLYRDRQYADALEILDRLDQEFPDTKRIMHPRARCLHRLGRTDECLQVLELIISRHDHERSKQLKQRVLAEQATVETPMPQGGAEDSATEWPGEDEPSPQFHGNNEPSPQFHSDDDPIPQFHGGDDPTSPMHVDLDLPPQLLDDYDLPLGEGEPAFDALSMDDMSPAFSAPVPDFPPEGPNPWVMGIGIGLIAVLVLTGGYFFLFYGGGGPEDDFEAAQTALIGYSIGMTCIMAAVMIFYTGVTWILYVKAGQPGWAVLIPIYNMIVFVEICERPIWWFILLFIPIVQIVITIILMLDFNRKFGQPAWHFVLAFLFGFAYYPYLAFSGNVQYEG